MTRPRRALLGLLSASTAAALLAGLLAPAAAAAPEELRLKDLDKGAPPGTPYVVDRLLVDGDVRVTLPRSLSRLIGKVGDDYLVQGYKQRTQKERVARVTPAGAVTILVEGTSVGDIELAPDGTSFVSGRSGRSRTTRLWRYDAGTGDVTAKTKFRGYGSVLGYDGTRVVVGVNSPNKTVSWNVESGAVSTIARRWSYQADLANDLLAWMTKDPYLGGCSVVSSLSDPGEEIWRSCDEAVTAFSTDGSHIATTHILADGLGPGRFTLRKTSGRKLGVYDAPYYFGRIWFEDATHVLTNAYARTKTAVVRCDGQGCERATRISAHRAPLRSGR